MSRPTGYAVSTRALLAPVLALLVLLPACGPRGGDRDGEATITVLVPDLDEWLAAGHVDEDEKFYFFEPLIREKGGEFVPALARSWEHTPDRRRWTVRLRSDVRWHDGTPFTAHDVKFTVDLWSHREVRFYNALAFPNLTVVDDTTLTVEDDRPVLSSFWTWGVFYPKHLLENLEPAEWQRWPFWTRPVGNGPWRYVRHLPKTMMELEANPDYYLGRPRIDRVILKFGGSPITELLAGEVDMAPIAGPDVPRIRADPKFRVVAEALPSRDQIFWNHRDPLFSNRRVRRALTLAIDRREIQAAIHYPPDSPLYDGLCSSRQFHRGECGPALPFDPGAAARLLDDAGWRDTDGDGIRDREGRRFTFTLISPPDDYARAAVLVQEHLRRVGVAVDVWTMDRATARDRLMEHAYEAAIGRIPNSAQHHWEYFVGRNEPGYADPRAARLLERVRDAVDPEEVDRIYRELGELFRRDVPVTMRWTRTLFTAYDRRIRGFERKGFAPLAGLWVEEP